MKPLSSADPARTAAIAGVVFDLDDTLLTHGRLTRDAYDAMWDLHDAGFTLIAATGRPIGWAEVVARQWPVAGVVAENGAIFAVRKYNRVSVHDRVAAAVRADRMHRLARVVQAVRDAVPSLGFSDDAHHRKTDVAWDIGEHVTVDTALVEKAMGVIERESAYATRSSVHLHASYDVCEKADGVLWFASDVLGLDVTSTLNTFAFVGDSPNDQSCFAAFSYGVGVANVANSLPRLRFRPRFVTEGEAGAGFRELANHLLLHRRVVGASQQ